MHSLKLATMMLAFVLVSPFSASYADANRIIVVSRADNDVPQLSKSQVRQIFMGGTLGRKFEPVFFASGNEIRTTFNNEVIGLTEHRVKAYWTQLQFTGRAMPPIELNSIDEVIDYLLNNPNSVAYLPGYVKLPPELAVVYQK
ncbi:hypothetical protein JYB87_10010 [Shewanella avicenniae]|uniref:Phosphate ABC transporter substrate-binding protein n=1 Tax=Shewanella avicenniae TaxID=2814294 RepID=A0ABX7QN30_9GAMM|nr:hypothetical protein [Shewanella avicenniae]QSX32121.1 hypothetical protein JYB87_10010 [Shewanella avicenniae]